jgi:hypothetical protein
MKVMATASPCCFENIMTDVVFSQRKAYIGTGRHWIGGKRGEINVGDKHVLMRTENISCNFAKQRIFSCTQQEIGSFLFCFSFLDSAIRLWEKGLDFFGAQY